MVNREGEHQSRLLGSAAAQPPLPVIINKNISANAYSSYHMPGIPHANHCSGHNANISH